MSDALPLSRFDREPTLAELLSDLSTKDLHQALAPLVGEPFWLLAPDASVVFGEGAPPAGFSREALAPELEPIGYLSANCSTEHLKAASSLLTLLLRGMLRYRMAADLHLEAVHSDHEQLKQQHTALQASEARYRELSASLDAKVHEQVKTIEFTQRELYQAEKLAALGQLAAGVAHEINNPIGFVKSNMTSALAYLQNLSALFSALRRGEISLAEGWKQYDLDFILPDFQDLFQESIDGIERVAVIVADLKQFSAVDNEAPAPLDINDNIRAAVSMALMQLRSNSEIHLQLADLPKLVCPPAQINQLLLNLILNALQAVAKGGDVSIASEADGAELIIRVNDSGVGIAAEIMPRIFEPFFTTRPIGSGKGLGLTVARDIARSLGGRIEVSSALGAGSTFSVHLPLQSAIEKPESNT